MMAEQKSMLLSWPVPALSSTWEGEEKRARPSERRSESDRASLRGVGVACVSGGLCAGVCVRARA